MPYTMRKEAHGIFKKFWGCVSYAEIFDSVLTVHSDPDFERFSYSIYDMLDVESFESSAGHLLDIAAHSVGARYTNPVLKVVLVSTDPGFIGVVTNLRDRTRLDITIVSTVDAARALFV